MSLNIGTKYVPGSGSVKSRIYIIGESPGFDEEKKGEPFIGASGELLRTVLTNAGINPNADCYIDNLCPYRPKDNDFNYCLGVPELTHQVMKLLTMIAENKPNIVLGLGGHTVRILSTAGQVMSHPTITQWRGSLIKVIATDTKFLSTYHPAFVLRNLDLYPIFNNDIIKLATSSQDSIYTVTQREVRTVSNLQEAQDAFTFLSTRTKLTVDIECSKSRLRCVGFGVSPTLAYSFNTENEALPLIFSLVARLLTNPNIEKVLQFGTFDNLWLDWFKHVKIVNYTHDTMVAQHVMWPELPRSLAYLTSAYTDMPYYKYLSHAGEDDIKNWSDKTPIDKLMYYNGLDCCATYEVHEKQMVEITEIPNWLPVYDFEISELDVAHCISMTGLAIDRVRQSELAASLVTKLNSCQLELNSILNRPINVKSPKQMMELLYQTLLLPKKTTEGNKLTTNEDAIVSLIGFCMSKMSTLARDDSKLQWKIKLMVLERILLLRGYYKLLGTYLNFDIPKDGRVRSVFKVASTDTGRWACESFIDDSGTNSQTFPRGEV